MATKKELWQTVLTLFCLSLLIYVFLLPEAPKLQPNYDLNTQGQGFVGITCFIVICMMLTLPVNFSRRGRFEISYRSKLSILCAVTASQLVLAAFDIPSMVALWLSVPIFLVVLGLSEGRLRGIMYYFRCYVLLLVLATGVCLVLF